MVCNYLLALAIFYQAPEDFEISHELFERIKPHLRSHMIQEEIIEKKECYFENHKDFTHDLNRMRMWMSRLADCPRIHEADSLPPMETICRNVEFNREYYKYVRACQAFELTNWYWQQVVDETNELHGVWGSAKEIKNPQNFLSTRRELLKNLQESIGRENYYAGKLPHCVPLWRFREIE